MKPLYIFSAILFTISLSIGLSERVRDNIRSALLPNQSKVLSVIRTVQIKDDLIVDIYKIKEQSGIIVKFINATTGEHFQTFSPQDSWDGYYLVNGRNTNLFLNDVDNDQSLEILAPTFTQNLEARLHVLKYDSASNNFLPFPF